MQTVSSNFTSKRKSYKHDSSYSPSTSSNFKAAAYSLSSPNYSKESPYSLPSSKKKSIRAESSSSSNFNSHSRYNCPQTLATPPLSKTTVSNPKVVDKDQSDITVRVCALWDNLCSNVCSLEFVLLNPKEHKCCLPP